MLVFMLPRHLWQLMCFSHLHPPSTSRAVLVSEAGHSLAGQDVHRPEGAVARAAHRQEIQVGLAARRQEVEPVHRLAGQPVHRPLGCKTGKAAEGASPRAGQATRWSAGQSAQEVVGWGLYAQYPRRDPKLGRERGRQWYLVLTCATSTTCTTA